MCGTLLRNTPEGMSTGGRVQVGCGHLHVSVLSLKDTVLSGSQRLGAAGVSASQASSIVRVHGTQHCTKKNYVCYLYVSVGAHMRVRVKLGRGDSSSMWILGIELILILSGLMTSASTHVGGSVALFKQTQEI